MPLVPSSSQSGRPADRKDARLGALSTLGVRMLLIQALLVASVLAVVGASLNAQAGEEMFLGWLALAGLIGAALLTLGSLVASGTVTRPIDRLNEAVMALQRGEHVQVEVTSDDEIGRLSRGFNAMVKVLGDREDKLTHLALHDHETGLPNRRFLERQCARTPDVRVIVVRLDRHEIVRNAIGHDAMTVLLRTLGARLTVLSGGASIARIGADSLGLAMEGRDADAVEAMIAALSQASDIPIIVAGAPIDVSLHLGVAGRGGPGAKLDSPIDRAAVAVEQARAAHKPWARFDEEAYGDPAAALSLISELMSALQHDQVSLVYQPKWDCRARRVTGVEALMRWTHPRRGPVSPDLFIAMAEETGHIRALTEWAVRRAIDDQRRLSDAGHQLTMAVNLSGRLLSDESFAELLVAAARGAAGRLRMEITETAAMQDPETALRIIERLVAGGLSVSLDDYGSGLSSLAYLKRIPADELKIDKAFVMGLDQSSRDALLVKSTIDLAHGLGMKVTAEGVETETSLALLSGMGCDLAQGYFIGRPMPLADLIQTLSGDRDAPRPGLTAVA